MNTLTAAVQNTLCAAGLWREDAVLLCAISGGCDSVALLHALCCLRQEKPFQLYAVHVQHHLRGEASQTDERFVRQLCHRLRVPLAVEDAQLSGDMHTPGMETLARERRLRIFEGQMAALGAHALLTAHHRDDQTETVLMHLLRGSGLHGLCGMQVQTPFGSGWLLRPFLTLTRQQLQSALAAGGLSWREDESNRQPVTPRNLLRLETLPRLETLFPGAGAHIAQLAETLSADDMFLQQEAGRLYLSIRQTRAPLFMLAVAPLARAPEALRRRVLRRWYLDGLRLAGLEPGERALSHADTLALSALVGQPAPARLNLPCSLMAARQTDWLHLVRQNGQPLCAAQPACHTVCAAQARYELDFLTLAASPPGALPGDAHSVILTPEWLARKPVLRPPQAADRIRPFGSPGHKPLRRYLTDAKIDPFLRPALVVLAVQNEVLWIPGLCTGEALRLEAVPQEGIELSISGETPFIPKSPKE